ncbi:MAG: hypothetical protein RLZZ200_2843 [Pseudomonadota bacterium]|jgi:hypothetical protein
MKKLLSILALGAALVSPAFAEHIEWEGRKFETVNVKAAVVSLRGEQVLRVERDLKALPFDTTRLEETVDDRHFLKLSQFDFSDVVFEVKMLARTIPNSPYASPQGFIGAYFRVKADNSAFESIYLRPNAGRSNNQAVRNHTVQYFAYPGYKFATLRAEAGDLYETYADIGMDEWITMRIHVAGEKAELFLNDAKYASFIVNKMKGTSKSGTIGLYVDIGTEGFFKDFRIISATPRGAGGA